MNLEVHAMGWWWWAPICRTRAYFRLLACLTSIHTYHPLEFCFVNFAFVISAFWEPKSFCTHSVFSCKIPSRALHRNIAMLPRGCQTPMKCFRCQGVPCAPMQGSSLLRCSNVMFLHNKCPTRPPYPCIRLALYKVQFSVFSDADALYAVQLQTVQIKKCILLTAARQPLLSKECSLS